MREKGMIFQVVPVEGDVCMALVVDIDNDHIASPRIDGWPGELAVDGKDGLFMAEPREFTLPYLHTSSSINKLKPRQIKSLESPAHEK
jgi:hypothetical protein